MLRRTAVSTATLTTAALLATMGFSASAEAAPSHRLSFAVTTTGDCTGTSLVARSGAVGSEYVDTELSDPDGNGTFTGERTLDEGKYAARFTVDGTMFKEVGRFTLDSDTTLRATYSCAGSADPGGPDDAPAPSGGVDTGGGAMHHAEGVAGAAWWRLG